MQKAEDSGSSLELLCPCCEATLVVDRATGVVIHHKPKPEAKKNESIGGILGNLEAKKESAEKLFQREMSSLKDRDRLLEEKLQEAFKRAKESKDDKPIRPFDMD
jgi:hypothetical protein